MKTYGGLVVIDGKQMRAIVTAKTKKRAVELLYVYNISHREFNNYWSQTANTIELSIADDDKVILVTDALFRKGQKMKKNKHGGAGRGAGRKPASGKNKIRLTVFVEQNTADYLRGQDIPIGSVIDTLVQGS